MIGVTADGERDILGLWAGDGGEGAKFWLSVFTEIKNRGVQDVYIAVCDALKGLPEAITTTWELATVQACIIHYAEVRGGVETVTDPCEVIQAVRVRRVPLVG